jgi:ATP-binding cassette subfamily B protein
VSFRIKAGETVAIVGHSGAGKSTIITLLLRGYDPKSGRVVIDGRDLRELELRSYLEQVGYVEQQVELFDESLSMNIFFGVPDAKRTDAEARLESVLKASRIDQFLPRLGEKGLDTIIGERGVRLSGGERQRVGIARALIKDPRVLIFDEATSSLDSENEALIHEAIHEALKGRTGIIIAHRLSTVRDADNIIVMKEGRVLGTGKHRTLLSTVPTYRSLVEHQLSRESEPAPLSKK